MFMKKMQQFKQRCIIQGQEQLKISIQRLRELFQNGKIIGEKIGGAIYKKYKDIVNIFGP
ncbi:MAG: hypothetical protein DRN14_06485 [Thermoplasmata archaeon]|nr:MAG: hypothetical protein DRN14_06485 [Thermoplasmata archaeon]